MKDGLYRIARRIVDSTITLFYRRVEVVGADRVPAEGAVILVANHPNSIADALLLWSRLTRRKIHFIAKDTIVRAPVMGWFMRRLGLIGVARPMEYADRKDLAKARNERALQIVVPRLLEGHVVAIFGEGVSTDARHLHVVRKGALRFGHAAEQAAGFKLGLVYVPVGINYSAKHRFRSNVLIRVGEPFRLSDLDLDPEGKEERLVEEGTARLQAALERLVVNIRSEELAGFIDRLANLLGNPGGSLSGRVERHQRIAGAVEYFNMADPRRVLELEQALARYDRKLAAAGLRDEVIRQRHPFQALVKGLRGAATSLVLLVLNGWGWANSFLVRWASWYTGRLGGWLARRRIARGGSGNAQVETALWATIGGWAGALVLFPLQAFAIYLLVRPHRGVRTAVLAALVYGFTLVPSWRAWLRWRDTLRRNLAILRDAFVFLRHSGSATRLQAERVRLQRELRGLLAAYAAQGPGGSGPPPG
jgi:glycerol-3-phosphate O-acyltransferase / dihydroxyacetone phosphate acyltransferase